MCTFILLIAWKIGGVVAQMCEHAPLLVDGVPACQPDLTTWSSLVVLVACRSERHAAPPTDPFQSIFDSVRLSKKVGVNATPSTVVSVTVTAFHPCLAQPKMGPSETRASRFPTR
jgi:hypothetical protein